MDLEKIRQNKGSIIFQFSIPAIIAMVLTALITLTDGYFTGNYIGKDAIAAINLGLPIVYLYLGLGLMISVGGSVISGICLGKQDLKKSCEVFNQTILTTFLCTALLSLLLFLFFTPVTHLLHVESELLQYFRDYYMISLLELPLLVMNNSFGMFIRSEGNPKFFMQISILNVVMNIILDALFVIYTNSGIKGIAFSSFFSALLCFVLCILYFCRKSVVYHFDRFAFDRLTLIETLQNGSSEFIGEMSLCITIYAYNLVILKNIGVDGITAFTIVGYISYVFSMIIIGFGQGSTPLISFTHGAGDLSLERSLRKTASLSVFVIGIIFILAMLPGADGYSSIFVKSSTVRQMVCSGIWIFMISFLFSGINTIASFYFTSIGKAKESALISSLRGLILLLVFIMILPRLFGMNGVFLIAPLTEAITFIISMVLLRKNDIIAS